MTESGYLSETDDDWLSSVFDMRSQHTFDAFRVLVDDRPLVEKALMAQGSLDERAAVAHLDRMWVDPSLRGRSIGLRLMREAQHVLGRYGVLVILKAHPDGDKVAKEDFIKLAKYYQSDKQLGLVPVSRTKRPGWLVGMWHEPVVHAGDAAYFIMDDRTGS
jgi:GNAT superfamily N-acetyltransferase